MKQLLFSTTDFEMQTFPASGPGGQHRDHGNTAVRLKHRPSGAVGEARDNRSQLQNKRAALKRLSETSAFRLWVNRESAIRQGLPTPEQLAERAMKPENLRVEYKDERGRWTVVD